MSIVNQHDLNDRPHATTLSTGLRRLDAAGGGIHPLTVLVGRPDYASRLALRLTLGVLARNPHCGVIYLTYARTPGEYSNQIAATLSGIPIRNLGNPGLAAEDIQRVVSAYDRYRRGIGQRLRIFNLSGPRHTDQDFRGVPGLEVCSCAGRQSLRDYGVKECLIVVDDLDGVGISLRPAADQGRPASNGEWAWERFRAVDAARRRGWGQTGDSALIVARPTGRPDRRLAISHVPGGGQMMEAADAVYLFGFDPSAGHAPTG